MAFLFFNLLFFFISSVSGSTLEDVLKFQTRLDNLKTFKNSSNLLSFNSKLRRKRDSPGGDNLDRPHTLELILVVDIPLKEKKNSDDTEIHTLISNIYNDLKSNYNSLDTNIVLLKHVVMTETDKYQDVELINGKVDSHKLLDNFNKWRLRKVQESKGKGSMEARAWQNHDTAHLLSGLDFAGSIIGLAHMKSVCSSAAAGVNEYNENTHILSSTVTHEIGHNLGLDHDGDSCTCTTTSCIMAPAVSPGGTNQWSSCSVDQFGKLSDEPCINNDPDPDIYWDDPECGDGIVTSPEECDCGSDNSSCNIDCCDASTCKFRPGMECDKGLCCDDQCKFKELAHPCRPEANECDLIEVCSGMHAYCPVDVFKRHEEQCSNDSRPGYCYDGKCRIGHDQCSDIYGPGAVYDPACYEESGLPDQQYNKPCNYLMCKGTYSQNLANSVESIGSNGCFAHKKEEDLMPIQVADGTSCTADHLGPDQDGICRNRICTTWVDPAEVNSCPGSVDKNNNNYLECSGHGVCNSEGNCHCDCGYAPPYCLYRGEGGSVDSATVCPSNFTTIIIILCVVLFLVIPTIFILILRWYLKKNKFEVSFKGFLDLMGVVDDGKPAVSKPANTIQNNSNPNVDFQTTETESPGAVGAGGRGGNIFRSDPGRKYEVENRQDNSRNNDDVWGDGNYNQTGGPGGVGPGFGPASGPASGPGPGPGPSYQGDGFNYQQEPSVYNQSNTGYTQNGGRGDQPPVPMRDYQSGAPGGSPRAPNLPNRDYLR